MIFYKAFYAQITEVNTVKRLLSIVLAFTFVVMSFAACAKLEEDDFSDFESSSDSDISDIVIDDNSNSIIESNDATENNNITNNNNTETDNTNSTDNNKQETPTFNVKESTAGLKFVLNADKLSYTLIGKGDAKSKDIVIDGHNGLPVTKIGYSAFGDDKTITSVKIGDYVETIEDQAFSMCSALTSVTFGKNVKFLGDYSFRYCTALVSIELGKNIEVIKYGAFYNCKNLVDIKAYGKIRIIEDDAFMKTKYSTVASNWKNKVLYIGTNLIQAEGTISGTYKIEPNTTCIGGLAFYGCASLSGVVIPDSVHSIGLKAFANTTALNNITIGNGVTYIGERAFINAGYYKTASKWSGNVLYVGNYLVASKVALSGAYSVISGTKVIADFAFNNCINLTGITIPDSVVYLGEYAFHNCEKLSNVTVGTGLKEIGIYAFKDCTALKNISIKKTSGWTAGDVKILPEQLSTKEQAAIYIAIVYSDRVWLRA